MDNSGILILVLVLQAISNTSGHLFNISGLNIGPPPPMTKTCMRVEYNPGNATCCDEHVINQGVPEDQAQCCGERAYRRNETLPLNCTEPCGNTRRHPQTELCCNGKTFWIGIDNSAKCCGNAYVTGTTKCCAKMFPLKSDDPDEECCGFEDNEKSLPYNSKTMRCEDKDKNSLEPLVPPKVTIMDRITFNSSNLCNGKLLRWDNRPLPNNPSDSLHHIQLLAQACPHKKQSLEKLEISFLLIHSGNVVIPESCAGVEEVTLVVRRGEKTRSQTCDVIESLKGKIVDAFFTGKKAHLKCKRNKLKSSQHTRQKEFKLILTLKEGARALLLLTDFKNALTAKGKG